MQIRSVIGVLVAGAALSTSAGCSEASSTAEAPRGSTSVASDREFTGTGYGYDVPRGWDSPAQDVPGFDLDTFAVDRRDNDGFTDNVNVILAPGRAMPPRQTEVSAKRELAAAGARRISVNDRVRVAGVVSPHLSAVMSLNSTPYAIDQYYVTANGQTYLVTFSFSRDVRAGDRAEVMDAVLTSWVWAN